MRSLEPLQRFRQRRHSRVEFLQLDQAVSLHGLDHGGVKRNGGEGKRLLATSQTSLRVAPLDLRRAGPPPTNHLEPEIIHRLTMLQGSPAVLEARLPFAEAVSHTHETPQCAADPPDVAARLEHSQRALARRQAFPQIAGHRIDVSQTALGKSTDLFKPAGVGDRQRFATISDGYVGPSPCDAMEKTGKVAPGREPRGACDRLPQEMAPPPGA